MQCNVETSCLTQRYFVSLFPPNVVMQCFPGTLIRCMDNELYKQTDKSEANIILCSSLEANTRQLQLTHVCSVLMFEPPPKYGLGSNNRNAPIILSLSRGSRLSAVKIVALCCHTFPPTSWWRNIFWQTCPFFQPLHFISRVVIYEHKLHKYLV